MKVYYINSTHWDREWYLPFQSFRYKLVKTVDKLIELMENDPDYPLFCFDGQTIVLEDYAEIEPKKAEKLKKLISSGRIKVGPWYVMPDEFLVSGESLIRNFMMGHRIAGDWGAEPWKYGYVNDIFGHIAQFPQILKGFGIDGAYLGRGLGCTDFSHFIWKSPDGSECVALVSAYGKFGRSDVDKFGTEAYPQKLHEYIDTEVKKSGIPVVLFSNTDDHRMPNPKTPQILKNITEEYPDYELCDGSTEEMVKEVAKYRDEIPTICGELTKPRQKPGNNLDMLYNTLSSYYTLKKENDYCQNTLERKTEPMAAFSKIDGFDLNHKFVKRAYKWLIQNHPHDSICGCSIDQVHKDMIYRFDQVKEICDCLYGEFANKEREVFWAENGECEYRLRVYNIWAVERKRTVTADIYFYKDSFPVFNGYAGKEKCYKFKILDTDGREVPYQILGTKLNVRRRNPFAFQCESDYDVYTVVFESVLPAGGYSDFKIVPNEQVPFYKNEDLICTENSAENKYIKLEISENGRFTLTDKRNKKTYANINGLLDCGEIGDGWHYQKPINDEILSDKNVSANVSLVSYGNQAAVFKIEKEFPLPAFLDENTHLRSGKAILKIVSKVTVYSDRTDILVETEIDNNVKDHKLTLTVPTYTNGENYFAGQAFYCCERKCGIDESTKGWFEEDSLVKNTNGIVGKRDKNGEGIAFVSAEGIHEAGCDNDINSTLNITLYRCFDRVFLQQGAKAPQLQQKLKFTYAIVPLCCETEYSDLLGIQHDVGNTDISYTQRFLKGEKEFKSHSYFSADNSNIVFSIFKCAENGDGYILRLFNASSETVNSNIQIGIDAAEAAQCNLNEEHISKIDLKNKGFSLSFKPWEIKTVWIK